jgi:hypothetical protein
MGSVKRAKRFVAVLEFAQEWRFRPPDFIQSRAGSRAPSFLRAI